MQNFISTVLNMGPTVLMPIIFFIIALFCRVKIGYAFKAALSIAVGFIGLGLVITLLLNNLGPATHAMINKFGVDLTIIDTGWAVAATIGWGSSLMVGGVLMFMIINLVMFLSNFTKTVNIDIFNYYLYLVVGAIIYSATGSAWVSYLIMAFLFIFMLKVADWTAPRIQKEYGIDGISFPHMNTGPWVPFGMATNWMIDKVPFLNKIELNSDNISQKFGVIGEPIIIGFFLGGIIGVLSGFNAEKILLLSVNISAAMVLLPRMVGILMEGLNIVKDAVRTNLNRKYPNKTIYIGMDVAIISTSPTIMATGIIFIPITILLALVLPGNKVLPLVDLPSLIFILPMMGAFCKKDIFRMLVSGVLMVTCILYIGTDIAGYYTDAAKMSGVLLDNGIKETIAMNSGATNPLGWIGIKFGQLIHYFIH